MYSIVMHIRLEYSAEVNGEYINIKRLSKHHFLHEGVVMSQGDPLSNHVFTNSVLSLCHFRVYGHGSNCFYYLSSEITRLQLEESRSQPVRYYDLI